MSSAPAPTETRANTVYASLRSDILEGRYPAGTRLHTQELSAEHGVSPNAVREALNRLAGESLVVALPQRGFRVFSPEDGDLRDLTTTRTAIESLALEWAIARGDIEWEASVLAAYHRLEHTPMSDDCEPSAFSRAWMHAHREFHLTLIDGCNSPRLASICHMLLDASQIHIAWSPPSGEDGEALMQLHRAMRDAIVQHDVAATRRAIAQHNEHTLRRILGEQSQ